MPEPRVWERAKASGEEQGVTFFRILRPTPLPRTVYAALMTVGAHSTYYAIFTRLPIYLKTVRHLRVVGSSGYLLVIIVGWFCDYVFSGYVNDWLGRKPTFAIYGVGSGTVILIYTHFPISNTVMLILSFPLGFFASGIFSGFGPFLSELFPTAPRRAGQGFTYNFWPRCRSICHLPGGPSRWHLWSRNRDLDRRLAADILCLIALLFLPETRSTALLHPDVRQQGRAIA